MEVAASPQRNPKLLTVMIVDVAAFLLQEDTYLTGIGKSLHRKLSSRGLRTAALSGALSQSQPVNPIARASSRPLSPRATSGDLSNASSTLGGESTALLTAPSAGLSVFEGLDRDPASPMAYTQPAHYVRGKCSMQFHSCRPDMAAEFDQVAEEARAAGASRVAVLICGNQGILDGCMKKCAKYSREGIRFDCHYESFGFV
jgi:Ferric reductase NAD binding domain